MSDKPKNPPAFPVLHSIDGNWVKEPLDKYSGMTLRDYFAGQALIGIVAHPESSWLPDRQAEMAYEQADAMLQQRAK